jgi:hypothetical protein
MSCSIYDQELIDNAQGGNNASVGGSKGQGDGGTNNGGGSGGRATGGSNGGGASDGGTNSGGRASGGLSNGGMGGEGDGGTNSGGTAPGGGGDGASNAGGGENSGGSSGGMGSGGSPPDCSAATAPCVVDDLEHIGSASYSSLPFRGAWFRYIEDPDPAPPVPPEFTADSMAEMIVAESAENDNGTLHVQATGLTEWGLGVFLTLKAGSFQDLSGYTGIRFRARSMNSETAINVALADEVSHSPTCQTVNDGEDCNHHMRSSVAPTIALDSDWTTLELPLNGFVVSADSPPRTIDVNLEKVYAIHFQIDTEDEEADYYIDDIELY